MSVEQTAQSELTATESLSLCVTEGRGVPNTAGPSSSSSSSQPAVCGDLECDSSAPTRVGHPSDDVSPASNGYPPSPSAHASRCGRQLARTLALQWLSHFPPHASWHATARGTAGLSFLDAARRASAGDSSLAQTPSPLAGPLELLPASAECAPRLVRALHAVADAAASWEEVCAQLHAVRRLVRNRAEVTALLDRSLGPAWRAADADTPPPLVAEESGPTCPPERAPNETSPFGIAPSPDAAPYYFSGGALGDAARRAGPTPSFPSTPPNRPAEGGAPVPKPPTPSSMSSTVSSPAVTFNLETREEMLRRRTAAAAAAAAGRYAVNANGGPYYDARPTGNWSAPVSPMLSFMSSPLTSGYCPFDYLLVLDFEATCEEVTPPIYLHEIIEFPVVVVDVKLQRTVAEFHRFVKPKVNPHLSHFCCSLTGIQQDEIDSAAPLDDVIKQFERWYSSTIPPSSRAVFVTDGSADMREFMYAQSVVRQGIRFPSMFYQWIDVKRAFAQFFQCQQGKIKAMLDALHCPFQGRLHSGIDDARNVATIVIRMLQLGCSFCEIPLSRLPYVTHSNTPILSQPIVTPPLSNSLTGETNQE